MKIKEILKKIAEEGLDKLTPEERATFDAYEDVDFDKLANDRAAKARKDAEGKLQNAENARLAVQKELEDLKKKLEGEEDHKKSDLEKLQAKVDQLTAAIATEKTAREQAEAANKKLTRSHKIDKVFATIPLVEGVDPETVRLMLDSRLKDEDLEDDELVQLRVEEFKQKNKALIRANTGGGGGGSDPEGGRSAGGSGNRDVDLDALLAQAQNGNMEEAQKALDGAAQLVASGKARLKGNG